MLSLSLPRTPFPRLFELASPGSSPLRLSSALLLRVPALAIAGVVQGVPVLHEPGSKVLILHPTARDSASISIWPSDRLATYDLVGQPSVEGVGGHLTAPVSPTRALA